MKVKFDTDDVAINLVLMGNEPKESWDFSRGAMNALNGTPLPPGQRQPQMTKMHALYLSESLGQMLHFLYRKAVEAGELEPHQKAQDLVRKLLYSCGVATAKHKRFVLPTR